MRTYDDLDEIRCPACDLVLSSQKAIPAHCSRCKMWDDALNIPYSEFNFHRHFEIELYSPGLEEGVDYVSCKVCRENGESVRKRRILDHVQAKHGLGKEQYLKLYPDAYTCCDDTNQKRSETVRNKYGVDNVFQAEEVKEKFDPSETAWSEKARKKRAETNRERYGHENPLGGEQGKEKARQGMLERYGVENPQQHPEIRQKTLETTEERYGDEYYVQIEEFREQFVETCLEEWGANHPMKTEEGRQRVVQGMLDAHGVEHPMELDWVKDQINQTCQEKYGEDWYLATHEAQQKAIETWQEKYGVDNPSKAPEIKAKIKQTWQDNYGQPFPPQSIQRVFDCPNQFEQRVGELSDRLYFTGDASIWIDLPALDKTKNPDFIVIPSDTYPTSPDFLNTFEPTKVVEAFGTFWHGPEITGLPKDDHESHLVDAYRQEGIDCLVLWEDQSDEWSSHLDSFLVGF